MFVISSRRVIATSVLFLIRLSAAGFDFFRTRFLAALKALRVNVGGAAESSRRRAHQRRRAYGRSPNRAVNRRVGIRGSREMDRNGFEGPHLPDHAFFGAAQAGNSGPDRPAIGNLIEMTRGAGGVSDRPFAAHFV